MIESTVLFSGKVTTGFGLVAVLKLKTGKLIQLQLEFKAVELEIVTLAGPQVVIGTEKTARGLL